MADLLKRLEQEHREVEKLLERLEHTEEPDQRMELLQKVEAALSEHMRVEEEQVYPLMAAIDGEMAEEAQHEHDGARELLAKVREMAPDTPGFGASVAALAGAIAHHVEDEENEAFPKLRQERPEGLQLDDQADDASELSRDELYEQAKELDVSGRSSMSKDELAAAVSQAKRG